VDRTDAAYLILRTAIFGDPLQVYPGTSPVASLLHGDWFNVVASMGAWFAALMPVREMRIGLLAGSVVFLVAGAVWCGTRRATFTAWWPMAVATLLSIVLVLPHLQTLAPTGEQGRLFYMTSALFALTMALPVSLCGPKETPQWTFTLISAGIIVIACETALVRSSIAPWSTAGKQAATLLAAIPEIAIEIPAAGYGFILVPDHIGDVPFGRNAQGGMLSPPTQPAPLSTRVIVQTADDLAAWPGYIRRGLVTALRTYPLERVWTEIGNGEGMAPETPTHYFCWAADGVHIIPVHLDARRFAVDWLAAWRDALADGPCAVRSGDVPTT
jgi:hypothetical protein